MKKIFDLLTPLEVDELKQKIHLHDRFSYISFSLSKLTDDEVVILVKQDKSFHKNAFSDKRLNEIVKETFSPYVKGRAIHIRVVRDKSAPPDIVDAQWIQKQQLEHGIRNKQLVNDLGMDRSTISAYRNGHKELSGVVRAMFYYYFLSIQ